MDFTRTPIYTALLEYKAAERYHMPGHKGRLEGYFSKIAPLDITELNFSDNLFMPQGIIKDAQALLSLACGSYACFMLTDGASLGITVMLGAIVGKGSKLLCARNIHRSVTDACVLFDIEPVFLPQSINEFGELLPIDALSLEQAIIKNADVKAVLVTSPDYFGRITPLEQLAKVAHKHNILLLVDEAHGAHLPYFEELLHMGAAMAGADAWVQSMHKTMGALTQGALLHIGNEKFKEKIQLLLPLCCTSSPSYLIMASIDLSRKHFQCDIDKNAFINKIKELRQNINLIKGLRLLPEAQIDITRLTIDVRERCSGYIAENYLRECDIIIEMADAHNIVLILTPFDTSYTPLIEALEKLPYMPQEIALPSLPSLPALACSPREAALGKVELVAFEESVGRIAAVNIGSYPPGIPLFCCGERIEAAAIEYLLALKKQNCTVFGLQQEKIAVVKRG